MKNFFSVMLALCMLFGCMVGAFAADLKEEGIQIEIRFVDVDNATTFESLYRNYTQDGVYLLRASDLDCPEGYYFYPAEQDASITIVDGAANMKIAEFLVKQFGVAGGNGSKKTPYVILDKGGLNAMRQDSNANYVLGGNVDFGANGNFTPIPEFKGTLDGNNCSISNIFTACNDIMEDGEYGMFVNNRGVVRNLIFDDCALQGAFLVGMVASRNYGSIENCHVVNGSIYAWFIVANGDDIAGDGAFLGGLAGINYGKIYQSSVTYTYFMGTRGPYQGCITGCNFGTVEQCYAAYNPMNREQVFHENMYSIGGLVGGNMPGGVVNNCFAGEFVTNMYAICGTYGVGGLIGANAGTVTCSGSWNQDIYVYTLQHCHNCIGYSQDPERVEFVFYQDQNNVSSDEHGTSRTRDELMSGTILEGWSTDIWIFEQGKYPRLRWQTPNYEPLEFTVRFIDPITNSVMKTEKLAHGHSATAPTNVKKYGYYFNGWDKDFSNITSDMDVYAIYYFIGDVNRNGEINTGDASLALRMTLDLSPMDADDAIIADVNYSGAVNTGDVSLILRYATGLIDSF